MRNQKSTIPLFFLVLFLSTASFIGIFITPALPAIAHFYGIGVSNAAALVSLYLIGYGLGQLLYAPIADRFGRKHALYVGFSIALIGVLLTLIAVHQFNFNLLLLGRIIIAVGAGAGFVTTQVIITDLYNNVEARKVYSLMLAAFAVSPLIAQAVGGYLTHHFGWQIINYAVLVFLLFNLVCVMFIAETLKNKLPMQLHKIHHRYTTVFKNFRFVCYLLLYAISGGAMYLFNTLASIIGIGTLHLNPEVYGFLYAFPAVGIIVGSVMSSKLSGKVSANKMIFISLLILIAASAVLLISMVLNHLNVYTLFGSSVFILMGAMMMNPNASMEAINSTKEKANAGAALNASVILIIALILKLGTNFEKVSLYALPLGLLLLCGFGLIILFITNQNHCRDKTLTVADKA